MHINSLGIATMTLVLSVVTESWAVHYRSTIEDAQIKKEFERSQDTGIDPLDLISGSAGDGSSEVSDSAETLGEKLRDAAKGFHEHAKYFLVSLLPFLAKVDRGEILISWFDSIVWEDW